MSEHVELLNNLIDGHWDDPNMSEDERDGIRAAASRLEELERENAELKARLSVPQEIVE